MIELDTREIKVRVNGHVIRLGWFQLSHRVVLEIDGKIIEFWGWDDIYEKIINPLVNGRLPEPWFEALMRIAMFKDIYTQHKYIQILADYGPPGFWRWYRRSPKRRFFRRARLKAGEVAAVRHGRNGWIVVNFRRRKIFYVNGRRRVVKELSVGWTPWSEWHVELIKLLERGAGRVGDPVNDWMLNIYLRNLLEIIPREWVEPLGLDELLVEKAFFNT